MIVTSSPKTDFTISASVSAHDNAEVYRLRYEAYREPTPEFAGPGPGMSDEYDGQLNCISYILKTSDGRAVGSIRPCIYSEAFNFKKIPVFDIFGSELIAHFGGKVPMVQSTHFVMDETFRGVTLAPKLQLIGEILRSALDYNVEHITSIVRPTPSLLNFYGRIGLSPVGDPKMHPQVLRPAVLIAAQTGEMLRLCRENRVFRLMVPESYR